MTPRPMARQRADEEPAEAEQPEQEEEEREEQDLGTLTSF